MTSHTQTNANEIVLIHVGKSCVALIDFQMFVKNHKYFYFELTSTFILHKGNALFFSEDFFKVYENYLG